MALTKRTPAEEQLVTEWRAQREELSTRIAKIRLKPNGEATEITRPEGMDVEVWSARLARTFGTASSGAQRGLITQLNGIVSQGLLDSAGNVTSDHADEEERLNTALAHVADIGPKDGLEALLAVQMVAVHRTAMEQLRRAQIQQSLGSGVTGERTEYINHCVARATRLLRTFTAQLDALNRHRGKGPSEQRVVVEHVHVHDGGQAIVGAVSQGARANGDQGATGGQNGKG